MPNNLRTLKKDVDYLVDEVISDCCTFIYINPDKNEDEVIAVINQAVELRDRMFDRINNIQDNPVKPYFKAIKEDLIKEVDALFQKISELAK
ncbi:MAG: hypothetical protein WC110_09640 [Bacteroidales bacterium]|jgi:hypothetical protein|nr:hypothetical protein [Bacteroidales bacterium]MDD4256673.1 hypothetical protein [Bacteroidales bacterium]MDD4655484.1 hypothetical protein [Bacteroidales bacterium]MDD4828169.1 hypothetical protein [Bacteroidales bacterium]HPS25585.1 hypothetical protein [Bacteroidales bacterium]